MAVCEHNVQRWEPDSREEGEAASRALYALTSEPKQLRFQAPVAPSSSAASSRRESERGGGGMAMVRRSFSLMTRSSIKESNEGSVAGGSAAAAGPPDLARASSGSVRSVGGVSAAGSGRGPTHSFSHFYSTLHVTAGQQRGQQGQAALGRLQRMRSDRTTSTVLSSEGGGSHRLVSVGSPVKAPGGLGPGGYSQSAPGAHAFSRRSTYAGPGAHPHHAGKLLSAAWAGWDCSLLAAALMAASLHGSHCLCLDQHLPSLLTPAPHNPACHRRRHDLGAQLHAERRRRRRWAQRHQQPVLVAAPPPLGRRPRGAARRRAGRGAAAVTCPTCPVASGLPAAGLPSLLLISVLPAALLPSC